MRALFTAVVALAATETLCCQAPPTQKEAEQLVATMMAADENTPAGRTERTSIAARLATMPFDQAQRKAWLPRIQKAWSKGRKLEKAGDNWFWPANEKAHTERRGRYIIGGETRKPKALAINMHGGGVGSGDAGPAADAYGSTLSKLNWLMIAPQVLEATEHGWTDSGSEEFVLELVDCALRTWKLDSDKVFFVGHSMGGYGSWTLGGHHADRVAAIAPSAGAATPILSGPGGPIVDIQEGVLPSLRNVFVAIYQSTDDPQVPPASNQFAQKKLKELQTKWGGFEHDYWEVTGRGHAEPPGGYEAHLAKIAARTREVVPARVVWQPVLPWKRQFYWLWWETPVAGAVVVADLDRAANKVTITCDKPTDGLYVLLDERVLDLEKEIAISVNGTEVWKGIAKPDLGTLVLTSLHPDPKLQFVARARAFAGKDG